jgi:hypothetical protein
MYVAPTFNHLMEILTYAESLHKMVEDRQHISFIFFIYFFKDDEN